MNKDQLIQYVDEIANTDFKEKLSESDTVKDKIGKNQFRQMATLCQKADCYEEIRLMLEYKTAKGNGWDAKIKIKGEWIKVGEEILRYIKMIKEESTREDLLENIGLFFGYLHWKATVLVEENKAKANENKAKVNESNARYNENKKRR